MAGLQENPSEFASDTSWNTESSNFNNAIIQPRINPDQSGIKIQIAKTAINKIKLKPDFGLEGE